MVAQLGKELCSSALWQMQQNVSSFVILIYNKN